MTSRLPPIIPNEPPLLGSGVIPRDYRTFKPNLALWQPVPYRTAAALANQEILLDEAPEGRL